MTEGRTQQALIDRAADAVQFMREDPRIVGKLDPLLAQARAVAVFPRLIKASVLFGGEGGSGVMMVRKPDGSWSGPAFYSLGAASAGLQIGYQETSVIFLLMNQRTVNSALGSKLRLGTDATVVAADLGEQGESERHVVATADIYSFSQSGGVFAGVSLNGFVMTPRDRYNREYYEAPVSPREILFEGKVDRAESAILKDALSTKASAPSEVVAAPAPPAGSVEAQAPSMRECAPESRQADVCAQLYQPVCAEVDTGVRCVRAPCPESRTTRTYSNACEACRDPKTVGYREGECTVGGSP